MLWFGFWSIIHASFFDLQSWYPSFLVDVDELVVISGALLLATDLFWLKKNLSKI